MPPRPSAAETAGRASARVDLYLVAALAIGVAVRVWQFGSIPPGLNQDEASTAYDAFSILHYGIDRSGVRLPVVLDSWGSGMYALASYLQVPFIGAFGLSVSSARMAFLVAGVAAIWIFYHLLRESVNLPTARIGAALLAISPWHIMISRWGLDSNMFPFVFLLAAVCMVHAMRDQRWLVPAVGLTALSLYSYGTAYVAVPVFLGLCLAYGLRHRVWSRGVVALSAATFAVVAVPIVLFVLINTLGWRSIETPLFTIPRLTGVPRFQSTSDVDIFGNLADAAKLVVTQNDGLIWNVIPHFGVMYVFSAALAIPGFALLCRRVYTSTAADPSFVIVAWMVAGMAMCAFVSVNINRANILWFPFIACTAVTVSWLWRYRWAAIALAGVFTLSFGAFVINYFGPYRDQAAAAFYASFGEAIDYATAHTQGPICVTGDVNMPYIFVLFHTKGDPRTYARTVRYDNPGAEFQQVASYDRYHFGLQRCPVDTDVVIASNAEAAQLNPQGFTAKRFERYTVFTRVG